MKEPIATQAPKVAETESSEGGLTMAPPQFKFADSTNPNAQGNQRSVNR